jgi:hypothetical protein
VEYDFWSSAIDYARWGVDFFILFGGVIIVKSGLTHRGEWWKANWWFKTSRRSWVILTLAVTAGAVLFIGYYFYARIYQLDLISDPSNMVFLIGALIWALILRACFFCAACDKQIFVNAEGTKMARMGWPPQNCPHCQTKLPF